MAGRSPWALARTVVAAAGLGFSAVSLGLSCLDHYCECYPDCEAVPSSGVCPSADGGAPEAGAEAGSGSGSGSGSAVP